MRFRAPKSLSLNDIPGLMVALPPQVPPQITPPHKRPVSALGFYERNRTHLAVSPASSFTLGQSMLGQAMLGGGELIANGPLPGLLLQTVVVRGERTAEGTLIQAVALPWFEIIALLEKDPTVAFQLPPDRWEEMVAGAYQRAGFEEVVLTPRSGDLGRDVIATKGPS